MEVVKVIVPTKDVINTTGLSAGPRGPKGDIGPTGLTGVGGAIIYAKLKSF